MSTRPKEKLSAIKSLGSLSSITRENLWIDITPDVDNDWLNQRDLGFDAFIKMGDKKNKLEKTLFATYSLGLATGRDPWCYNSSRITLKNNLEFMISNYNNEIDKSNLIPDFTPTSDPRLICWNRNLKEEFAKKKKHTFSENRLFQSLYRPFEKRWTYFSRDMNAMVYLNPKLFPTPDTSNMAIVVSGKGSRSDFSAIITKNLIDLNIFDGGGQCFPLYHFEKADNYKDDLFSHSPEIELQYNRLDGVTDEGLELFTTSFKDNSICKEDIFYYVYAILHSPDYRNKYSANLVKQLPRIPLVDSTEAFGFCKCRT